MPYSRFSTTVSKYLARELKLDSEREQVIAYSLDSLILYVVGYAGVIAVGWLLGIAKAIIVTIIAGDVLRKLSGGAHFSTPYRCLLFSAVSYPAACWASQRAFALWGREPLAPAVLLIICLCCLAIVAAFAPVDCPAKPIVSETFRKRLKLLAVIAVLAYSLAVYLLRDTYIAYAVTAGMALQSLTLLPLFGIKRLTS